MKARYHLPNDLHAMRLQLTYMHSDMHQMELKNTFENIPYGAVACAEGCLCQSLRCCVRCRHQRPAHAAEPEGKLAALSQSLV